MSRYTPARPWDNTPGYRHESRRDATFVEPHPGRGSIRSALALAVLIVVAALLAAVL